MGSIPACTGEPARRKAFWTLWQVYPRVYGGTLTIFFRAFSVSGLSPRVRGNLAIRRCCTLYKRSIPACTGEPCATTVENGP